MKKVGALSNYYIFKIKEHEEIKEKLISLILNEEKIIKTDNLGQKMTTNHFKKGDNYVFPYSKLYINLISKYLSKFVDDYSDYALDNSGERMVCKMSKPWFQMYTEEGHHTWHVHPEASFFTTYFLELPDDASPTYYKDYIGNEHAIEAEEGDLLIMPSFFSHCAIPNKSCRRIVIAADLKLQPSNKY